MTLFDGKTVAFIGGGVMGTAMIAGLLHEKVIEPHRVIVADPNLDRGEHLVSEFGVRYTADNAQAVDGADVVVLSVKPQFFNAVLADLPAGAAEAALIVSIMAGVSMQAIISGMKNARVVRSMPNTPGQIGRGMTVWAASKEVNAEGHHMATALLGALGETLYVTGEPYLDMATALSGSGPAYVFLFMEVLVDAGVHMGFPRADAEKLVMETFAGAVAYAQEERKHLAELRNQVTSPGGTTADALYYMDKAGLRTAIARGVWAAYQRSVALGGGAVRKLDE